MFDIHFNSCKSCLLFFLMLTALLYQQLNAIFSQLEPNLNNCSIKFSINYWKQYLYFELSITIHISKKKTTSHSIFCILCILQCISYREKRLLILQCVYESYRQLSINDNTYLLHLWIYLFDVEKSKQRWTFPKIYCNKFYRTLKVTQSI